MEIGTKDWHESLEDIGWEILALVGVLCLAGAMGLIIFVVHTLYPR